MFPVANTIVLYKIIFKNIDCLNCPILTTKCFRISPHLIITTINTFKNKSGIVVPAFRQIGRDEGPLQILNSAYMKGCWDGVCTEERLLVMKMSCSWLTCV